LQTIHSVQAGKDVYVEKPLSHDVDEARKMVDYGRETGRIIQMGTQQHSGEHYREAVELIREGGLGEIGMVRTWVTHDRPILPPKPDSDPPKGVDFDMWLGPAPNRPFNPNRFHYNWRWFWDTGSGELGNWGVHQIDIACWALALRDPIAVYSHGGLRIEDARETPDYQTAVYEYPDLTLIWEHRVWSSKSFADNRSGVLFYGTKASMALTRDGWQVFPNNEEDSGPSAGETEMRKAHFMDFVECVKSRETPNSSVETAYFPTLLCHLGNIAYRTKKRLEWDPETATFPGEEEANALLSREMRAPWKYEYEKTPETKTQRV
ncbi:MAG: Gfo/Idh/MocA family oxidoreductase, partial [Candidatus Omnitrophica bacterium]|nr:Gfo/Idh/MocA family oxidoreductase [Candidatus Omnitrophota bacterium]